MYILSILLFAFLSCSCIIPHIATIRSRTHRVGVCLPFLFTLIGSGGSSKLGRGLFVVKLFRFFSWTVTASSAHSSMAIMYCLPTEQLELWQIPATRRRAEKGSAPLWLAVGAQAVEILEDSSIVLLFTSPRAQLAVVPAPQRISSLPLSSISPFETVSDYHLHFIN